MNLKKVKQFIDNNFPPYTNYTILKEDETKAIALLEFGRLDKLRVTIGIDTENHSLYKLLQTDFM